ncbi:MAG: hypothetical protein WKF34_13715 [Pyrinomonadaceae bacterium]
MNTKFTDHLKTFSESDWLAAVDQLLPDVHEVDRVALEVWFRFYPLGLRRYVEETGRDEAVQGLALQGDFDLADKIDTSHHFLYGHRFWKTVKTQVVAKAETSKGESAGLADLINDIGIFTAEKHHVERGLANAIAAVGLATLNQVGLQAFTASPGDTTEPSGLMKKPPAVIVAEREKDDSQGLFGFLKTVDKKFSVAFSGLDFSGKFSVMNDQQLTHASEQDRSQPWQTMDDRCWEGPIPVECTAAACGTCWIGVLGGREKMNEVTARERRAMKVFGYNQPEEPKPFLRLACQSKTSGNVTVAIPPWNGIFGKKVCGNVEELELEPATTSARALRDAVAKG